MKTATMRDRFLYQKNRYTILNTVYKFAGGAGKPARGIVFFHKGQASPAFGASQNLQQIRINAHSLCSWQLQFGADNENAGPPLPPRGPRRLPHSPLRPLRLFGIAFSTG
jgi:hypothetical protein